MLSGSMVPSEWASFGMEKLLNNFNLAAVDRMNPCLLHREGKGHANSNSEYELPRYLVLWSEFYRVSQSIYSKPQVLHDVAGNQKTVERLKIISVRRIQRTRMRFTNGIVQGMPGIGKTTSIHSLSHRLLGDAYKERMLEFNLSVVFGTLTDYHLR